jgi:hypothetical protein
MSGSFGPGAYAPPQIFGPGVNASGLFYPPYSGLTNYSAGIYNSTNLTFTPFVPMTNMTLASLAFIFGNSIFATGNITLGVYSSDANGKPLSKIVSAVHAYVAGDSNTTLNLAMPGAIKLRAGVLYWIASGCQKLTGTNPPQTYTMVNNKLPSQMAELIGAPLASIGNEAGITGYYSSDVPGATMPANVGALTVNYGGVDAAVVFVGVA